MEGDTAMSTKTVETLAISKLEFARQVKEARKRGEESLKHDPRAISAKYENGLVTVNLLHGWSFSFNPRIYRGLKDATEEELFEVAPLGLGFALEWESIDQHLGVGPIILDLIGDKYLTSELGRRNGAARSERKRVASQTNGKLGGRPKKA